MEQSQTLHSRIWTKQSIRDVISDILSEASLAEGTDFEFVLKNQPQTEEHVCQYKESDLSFISRWLEREGWYYYFDHTEGTDKLVITDSYATHTPLVATPIRYYPTDRDNMVPRSFDDFTCTHVALPGNVKVVDYDYAKPMLELSSTTLVSANGSGDVAEYGQPGSNGITLDPEGRVTINEHGNRRVVRIEKNGVVTVLADRYQGKRLNSPNDLVYRSDGTLFFSDPPFGLPKFYEDPRKELPYSGVFAIYKGQLKLVTSDLKGPNGIAFSPDEKYLYVGNWDPEKKIVMRYEVNPDATLSNGKVFFDMTSSPGQDAIDGIKVDQQGNLYVSGPGGLWILSPAAKHLGTIKAPKHPHNLAWGGEDGKTLYLTAQSTLYRMPLNIPGIRPADVMNKLAAQR